MKASRNLRTSQDLLFYVFFFFFWQFPILKMNAWKSFVRTNRLKERQKQARAERYLEILQAKDDHAKVRKLPQIVGKLFEFLLHLYLPSTG